MEFVFFGRKALEHLLPRISAALAQFIAPVSSSDKKSSEASFERFKQREQASKRQPSRENPEQPKQEKPPAQVVPIRAKAGQAAETSPEEQPAKPSEPAERPGIGQAFLSLMSLFQLKRSGVSKQAGAHSYESAAERQNQRARFRKGAMLDRTVE